MRWPTHWTLPGSLTLRGTTSTEELFCVMKDEGGATVVHASALIGRRAFGIGVVRGLQRLDPLYALIGDQVRLDIVVRLPREIVP